jgi:hypothetical protein
MGGRMKDTESSKKMTLPSNLLFLKLTLEHILRIDEMLDEVGEYGEVHIIVQKGELRYINKVESYRFLGREEGE